MTQTFSLFLFKNCKLVPQEMVKEVLQIKGKLIPGWSMNLHFYKERKKRTKESKGVDQIRVFENTL